MKKSALRKYYLDKRKALSTDEISAKSEKIKDLFFQKIDFSVIQFLHIFLPIKKQNEINTFLIISVLQQKYPHIKIVVSRSIIDTHEMQHFMLKEQHLVANKWGILEPSEEHQTEILPTQIDLIIIPLLIFDKQGNRVGYGKGFYDRFLQKCSTNALKVGICTEEPIDEIDDINEFDVKINTCITPSNVFWFD